mmetsp:Transcript_50196/g.155092  ORF Transcript_50196/g.155092 Transcript_50196/m.155092 type:complete len:296 (+) Transcript_50196:116-1003(+)
MRFRKAEGGADLPVRFMSTSHAVALPSAPLSASPAVSSSSSSHASAPADVVRVTVPSALTRRDHACAGRRARAIATQWSSASAGVADALTLSHSFARLSSASLLVVLPPRPSSARTAGRPPASPWNAAVKVSLFVVASAARATSATLSSPPAGHGISVIVPSSSVPYHASATRRPAHASARRFSARRASAATTFATKAFGRNLWQRSSASRCDSPVTGCVKPNRASSGVNATRRNVASAELNMGLANAAKSGVSCRWLSACDASAEALALALRMASSASVIGVARLKASGMRARA